MDPFGHLVVKQWNLVEEHDRLISQIRIQPGFDTFLIPPSFDTLRSAAVGGPVILINHSKWRSDIIILLCDAPPSLIPTSNEFYDHAKRLPQDVNASDLERLIPLHLASNMAAAQYLLEHGADATAQDEYKNTPLHWASRFGRVEIAQLLLEHGADASAQDEHKSTSLHRASESGSVEVAQLLLKIWCRCDSPERAQEDSVASSGVKKWERWKSFSRLLLEHGANRM